MKRYEKRFPQSLLIPPCTSKTWKKYISGGRKTKDVPSFSEVKKN